MVEVECNDPYCDKKVDGKCTAKKIKLEAHECDHCGGVAFHCYEGG